MGLGGVIGRLLPAAPGRRPRPGCEPRSVSAPSQVAPSPAASFGTRAVLRTVLTVVVVVLALYLIYLLRRPLTWIFIAGFLAIALSGPVSFLSQRMKRGLAVAIVYVALILIPFLIMAALIPPVVEQGNNLAQSLPGYARDLTEFVQKDSRLRGLEEDYDITGKLEEQASALPGRLGDAAGVLSDIGVGLVNSIFAGVTIIVLSAFLMGSGRRWLDLYAERYPPDQARVDEAALRPHRQHGRQLRRGRARPGHGGRRAVVDRARAPRRAVRAPAGGRRSSCSTSCRWSAPRSARSSSASSRCSATSRPTRSSG